MIQAVGTQGRIIRCDIRWMRLFITLAAAYRICMSWRRLAIDGGSDLAQRSLMPARIHPAIVMLAYLAAVPGLAAFGALLDWRAGGWAMLRSPTGPHGYPLLVLILIVAGLPITAAVLDRRHTSASFKASSVPVARMEWPF